jgi:signal transduction histidine kinase
VGLGLSVTRQLVELMGGTIAYRRANGSTVFEVRLPLAPDSSVPAIEYANQSSGE